MPGYVIKSIKDFVFFEKQMLLLYVLPKQLLITTTSSTTFGSENGSKAASFDVFLVSEVLPLKFWLFRVNQFSGRLPSQEKRMLLAIFGQARPGS